MKYAVVHIEAVKRVVILSGVSYGVVVIVFEGTLIETKAICQYTQFTAYGISDSLK